MRITLIKLSGCLLFSIVLTLCTPLCVIAKENTKNEEQPSSVDTPTEQAPYTMEALLIGVREILTHPDEDGEMMAKKWMGIEKDEWGDISSPILTGDKKFIRERYLPTTPKPIVCAAYLNDKNRLFNLELFFAENKELTPALAHKIFGKPSSVEILSLSDAKTVGVSSSPSSSTTMFWVTYRYNNYPYPFFIDFLRGHEKSREETEKMKARGEIVLKNKKLVQGDIALHDEDYIARELYFYPNIPEIDGNYENYGRKNQLQRTTPDKKFYPHTPKIESAHHLTKQEALKRVPQTASALLLALKGLINNSHLADGKMLCEHWLGIHRSNWIIEETGSHKELKISSAAYSRSPFRYWNTEPAKNLKSPIYGSGGHGLLLEEGAPFEYWDLRLSEKGRLKSFTILLPGRISILKITPYDVKKILAEPNKISVYPPNRVVHGRNSTVYPPVTVKYQYVGREHRYRLNFYFHDDPQKNEIFNKGFYAKGRYFTKENKVKYHMEKIRQNTIEYYANYQCALIDLQL